MCKFPVDESLGQLLNGVLPYDVLTDHQMKFVAI